MNCGRSTRANGGGLGSQDRKDGMLHLQSPKSWLPCWLWHPLGNHQQTDTIPITNFPYYLGGRSLRRLEGAGIELSSVQLVHKFAATLSNTMIHKQFKNDKNGFWQIWALSRGPRGLNNRCSFTHSSTCQSHAWLQRLCWVTALVATFFPCSPDQRRWARRRWTTISKPWALAKRPRHWIGPGLCEKGSSAKLSHRHHHHVAQRGWFGGSRVESFHFGCSL